MKKDIHSLFLAFLFIAPLAAQVPQPIQIILETSDIDGSNFHLTGNTLFTYDQAQRLTESREIYWSISKNAWVNHRKFNYEYNAEGQVSTLIEYRGSNDEWSPNVKNVNTYDAEGHLIHYTIENWRSTQHTWYLLANVTQTWAGNLKTSWLYLEPDCVEHGTEKRYTYDNLGRLINEDSRSFSLAANGWVYWLKYDQTYVGNEPDYRTRTLRYWNAATGNWNPTATDSTIQTIQTGSLGKTSTLDRYIPYDNSWRVENRYISTLTPNDLLVFTSDQKFSTLTNQLEILRQTEKFLNPDGSISHGTDYQPYQGVLTARAKYQYVYPGSATATQELQKAAFGLAPNPAGDFVRVSLPEGIHSVQLTNVHGQLIFQAEKAAGELTVPLQHLPGGLYFFTVIAPGGQVMQQELIKQ